jgi:hypothetical protein
VCDCECGGVNHGTGRLVQTIVKEGKIKAVGFSEEDMLRAYKYRELRNYARGLCDAQIDYTTKYRMNRELDKVVAMRVYNPRLQALVNFIVKHKKQEPSSESK